MDDVRSVIEAAEQRDSRLAPLLMLAALTGMRRAELCALRWADVDLERRELDVSRSIIVVAGGLAEKSTKTDRFRMVALDDVGVSLLRYHRAKVDEWARGARVVVEPDGYVFSHTPDASKPFRPDNVTGFFTVFGTRSDCARSVCMTCATSLQPNSSVPAVDVVAGSDTRIPG